MLCGAFSTNGQHEGSKEHMKKLAWHISHGDMDFATVPDDVADAHLPRPEVVAPLASVTVQSQAASSASASSVWWPAPGVAAPASTTMPHHAWVAMQSQALPDPWEPPARAAPSAPTMSPPPPSQAAAAAAAPSGSSASCTGVASSSQALPASAGQAQQVQGTPAPMPTPDVGDARGGRPFKRFRQWRAPSDEMGRAPSDEIFYECVDTKQVQWEPPAVGDYLWLPPYGPTGEPTSLVKIVATETAEALFSGAPTPPPASTATASAATVAQSVGSQPLATEGQPSAPEEVVPEALPRPRTAPTVLAPPGSQPPATQGQSSAAPRNEPPATQGQSSAPEVVAPLTEPPQPPMAAPAPTADPQRQGSQPPATQGQSSAASQPLATQVQSAAPVPSSMPPAEPQLPLGFGSFSELMQVMREQLDLMTDMQTTLMGQFDLLNQQFDQLNRRQLYTKEQMCCVLDRITHLESRANEVQATTDGVFARLQALESTAINADATSVAATATTTTEDTAAAAAEAGVAPATGGAVGGTTATDWSGASSSWQSSQKGTKWSPGKWNKSRGR